MALPIVGNTQQGQSSLVSGIARGIFDGTRQSAARVAGGLTAAPRAVFSGIKDIVQPENLLKAAVGDNQLGQTIINKIFNDNKTTTNHTETISPEPISQPDTAPAEVLDKLTQIDGHIVDLGVDIASSGKSIERMVYQSTEAQTIVLTHGAGYNIVNDSRQTFNPLGLPDNRIVPALPSVVRNMITNIAHTNVNDILAREDNKHDDAVAEKQADDISAIRTILEKQAKEDQQGKSKTLAEKMTDRLLGNDDDIDIDIDNGRRRRHRRTRPGRARGRGRIGRGMSSLGSRAASMVRAAPAALSSVVNGTGQLATRGLSTVANVGRGAASLLGGIGAGTAAAGTAALLFGGTGLYSAYKAAKGEDASNWISNLVDSGVQSVTGDKDASLGTKLYDWLHPAEKEAVAQQPTIVKTPQQPTIAPAKEAMVKQLVDKQHTVSNTSDIKTSNTMATASTSTMVASPEPLPDAKRLESNKLEAESKAEQPQPVVVNVPQQAPQQQRMPQGHGGGQSIAPMLTRPTDSSLNRATDKMIRGSL